MAADEVVESGVDGGVSRTLSGVGRLEARRPSELASSMGPVPTTPLPRKQTATGSMFARLSHPKVQLVFKNVHLEVKVKDKGQETTKTILRDVNGAVTPGHILAIMGPSGAGKTSLLSVLSGRSRLSSGEININGVRMQSREDIRKLSGFVSQDDALVPTLTVRETFRFYARLKMSADATKAQREQKVNEIIDALQLTKAADTLVGDEYIRGLSGGERRRVTIGVELLTDPSLLFLDEPTSGLDSSTAVSIMEILEAMALGGRTIICTIHQPRSAVFSMFDQVLLMARGETVYLGPASNSSQFFTDNGYPLPEMENPADHFLDVLTMYDVPNAEEKLKQLQEAWLHTSGGEEISHVIQESSIQAHSKSQQDAEDLLKAPKRVSWLSQVATLMSREYIEIRRNPLVMKVRLFQVLSSSIVFGLIFLRLGDDQASVQSRFGIMLFLTVSTFFVSVAAVIQVFPLKRHIFLRERSSNTYSVSAYYVALAFADIPLQLLFPSVQALVVYFMFGFQEKADKFFIFLGILMVVYQTAYALGLALGSVVKNVQIGLSLGPLVVVIFLLYSGFVANPKDIPVFLSWILDISPVRYGFQSFALNEFSGLTFRCTAQELSNNGGTCPITSGESALAFIGISQDTSIGKLVGLLVCIAVVFRLIGFFSLYIKDYLQRR